MSFRDAWSIHSTEPIWVTTHAIHFIYICFLKTASQLVCHTLFVVVTSVPVPKLVEVIILSYSFTYLNCEVTEVLLALVSRDMGHLVATVNNLDKSDRLIFIPMIFYYYYHIPQPDYQKGCAQLQNVDPSVLGFDTCIWFMFPPVALHEQVIEVSDKDYEYEDGEEDN